MIQIQIVEIRIRIVLFINSNLTLTTSKRFTQIVSSFCMNSPTTYLTAILILFLFATAGCGQDDDQREFEQEAFQLPDGITETKGNGDVISEDPDDWRTSPFFQGLIFVEPAFPNPVTISDQLNLEIDITGFDAVSGLTVTVLIDNAANAPFRTLYTINENPLPPGFTSININPLELGRFNNPESARGIHRLIIFDNRQNIISYGDVIVE